MIEALALTRDATLDYDCASFEAAVACYSEPDVSHQGYSLEEQRLQNYGIYAIDDCYVTTSVYGFDESSVDEYLLQYRRPSAPDTEISAELLLWLANRPFLRGFVENSEREFSTILGMPVSVKASLFQLIDDDDSEEFLAAKLTVDYGVDFDPSKIIGLERELLEKSVIPAEDQLEDIVMLNSIYG
ncbi:MAG: hypothetical protein CL537_02925 [Alcanivoracaceae bacterium]|nr:hypothetical protein [Alcanivoracaceae bacterium]|tara:strand:+ start:1251 stop:1808 length:558 start_codon:yes stop_codon:yes gene_type:complete